MRGIRNYIAYLPAPLLLSVFPVIYLYRQNLGIVSPASLHVPLAILLAACVLSHTALSVLARNSPNGPGNGTLAVVAVFVMYGAVYDLLLDLDLVAVHHATLLPGMVLAAVYLAHFLVGLPENIARRLREGTIAAMGAVVAFNALGIATVEQRKADIASGREEEIVATPPEAPVGDLPDIYYILLDEFAGFDAARTYWDYQEINDFEEFLEGSGYFVAGDSRAATRYTLVEMASRLNYEPFALPEDGDLGDPGELTQYFEAISHNRAMRRLKTAGYTTVVFDGMGGPFAMEGRPPIDADLSYIYEGSNTAVGRLYLDEFGAAVLDLTMLRVASDRYRLELNPLVLLVGNNILYTFEKLPHLDEVPAPRFVYAHIMLPHTPFIFDEDGNVNAPEAMWDWHYYLGSYQFATGLLRQLVLDLGTNADPSRPPVVILQSDHGARPIVSPMPGSATLPDYPRELEYHILNAFSLPGYDYSKLEEDFDPINTFPLIFNFYLGDNLPLR